MRVAHEIFTGQTDTEPKQTRAELQTYPDTRKVSEFAMTPRSYSIPHPKSQQDATLEIKSTLPQEDQSSRFKISTPNIQTCWRLSKNFTQTVCFWQTGHRTKKGNGLVHATFMSQTQEDKLKHKGKRCKMLKAKIPEANVAWSPQEDINPSWFIAQICSRQGSLCQSSVFLTGKKISHSVFGALKLIHPSVELKQPPRVTLGSQLSRQHPVPATSLHSRDHLWMLPQKCTALWTHPAAAPAVLTPYPLQDLNIKYHKSLKPH